MKKLILFYNLLLLASSAFAQNWQTVAVNDTTYFRAGSILTNNGWGGSNMDSGLLRVIWIDSFNTTATENTYFFYKTIRTTSPFIGMPGTNKCLDTFAASWLGHKMVRKPDGTEYYYNGNGDTITMLTQAKAGDSWTILATSSNFLRAR